MDTKTVAAIVGLASAALVTGQVKAGGAATGLAPYVGHYPSDKLRGSSFRTDPRVVAAVDNAVSAPDIRRHVLKAKNVVEIPILALSAGRLFARSYDPAGGGSTNWAVLISGDGTKAAVCYSTDDSKSTWYYSGKEVFSLAGSCPSEKADVEARFGLWPVGAIPN